MSGVGCRMSCVRQVGVVTVNRAVTYDRYLLVRLCVRLNMYLVIVMIVVSVCLCTEDRVSLRCDNHLMKVCIRRDNADLSRVQSSLDADCSDADVGGVVRQTTIDGFCYIVDMSICRSRISNKRNSTNAVCILPLLLLL